MALTYKREIVNVRNRVRRRVRWQEDVLELWRVNRQRFEWIAGQKYIANERVDDVMRVSRL